MKIIIILSRILIALFFLFIAVLYFAIAFPFILFSERDATTGLTPGRSADRCSPARRTV
ncbi:MAG: hypothetical protein JW864_06145 [Spirochaetes bacterium]|nr:hypothetical protein [Spirochaetota bacterium]